MMKFFKFFLVTFFVLSTASVNAQLFRSSKNKAKDGTQEFNYEVSCGGVGTQGTSLIKVFSFSKKPRVAKEAAMRNAVHAIIFKGYIGNNGCSTQRPLAKSRSIELVHKEYFETFFNDGGDYMRYVNLTNNGAVGAGDIQKVSKRLFKVGVMVSVSKDELRKRLEKDGIIKGLSHGF
jgi:hypothetical protein